MTHTSSSSLAAWRDTAYPTVIQWPVHWDQAQIPQRLAATGAIDEASARLAAKRPPPYVLGRFDAQRAARIIDCICAEGGDAFAPALADLASLGASMKVRDMRMAHGHLEVDIWRGLTTTIRREHVQFLVRATIRRGAAASAARVAQRVQENVDRATAFVQYGWAARMAASSKVDELRERALRETSKVTEVLDIHTTSGSIFQVDGDKFAFGILGDMKGHSDGENMNRLAELISHIAPDEVVDTYFALFRPPPGHAALLDNVKEMRRNGEDAAFAFYSRWAALMYRHVMGA